MKGGAIVGIRIPPLIEVAQTRCPKKLHNGSRRPHVGEDSLVLTNKVEVNEASAADRPDSVGCLTEVDGRETSNPPLRQMLVDDAGLRET